LQKAYHRISDSVCSQMSLASELLRFVTH